MRRSWRQLVAGVGVLALGSVGQAVAQSRINGPATGTPPAPRGTVNRAICQKQMTVCYYDLCEGTGNPDQEAAILATGQLAVSISALDEQTLEGCNVLFAQNPNNDGYSPAWVAGLAAVDEAVQEGMVLIFHDRTVGIEEGGDVPAGGGGGACDNSTLGPASDFIPGLSATTCVRDFSDDANIEIVTSGTAVTNGVGGTITSTSLDGGTSSSHGYCSQSTLPGGAVNILSRTAPTESVAFSYRHGGGTVYYSTMPLDYYLEGSGPNPPRDNYDLIYAPNVVQYGAQANPACLGLGDWATVPTLSPAGLASLGALLALASLIVLRRRAHRRG